ncbi:MAG: TIGR04084 family radical SAM/SPASM domain-containing protein [Candidatus Thorarchaeota archaeon]
MILTRACNLKCRYCGEDALFEEPPIDLAYPIDDLKKFISQDEGVVSVQFYGGEPLLKIPLLEKIMDKIKNVKYWSIQTNALKLSELKREYLCKLDAILVSIDGREKTNDLNRGKGVYSRVINNCKKIRQNGFSGELIARMAISEDADIFEEVIHLADLTDPQFDFIHWQLDTQWDDDPNARWKDFNLWVENSYNPGISKLIQWWVEKMDDGKVIGFVPFIPLMDSILSNTPSLLRCGAGINSFAINPNGAISVCPISPEFDFSIVGDIWNSTPNTINNSMFVNSPCPSCDIFSICGGRCLFANKTKLWGETGFLKVCSTVKHLVQELVSKKEQIINLIDKGIINRDAFSYPKYNNGCEIIP